MRPSKARLRGSIGHCAVVSLALFAASATAQTYTVDIHPTLNGLDVKIEPVTTSGMLVVKLTNATDKKVRCDLLYDAAPQIPYRKTTYIDPGKTEDSVFSAKRKWTSVDVDVKCKTVEK